MKIEEIKKVYAKAVVARKEHWCTFCSHFAIQKGDKYHKVRVDAHLPFSKRTTLKPMCMKCAKRLALQKKPEVFSIKVNEVFPECFSYMDSLDLPCESCPHSSECREAFDERMEQELGEWE